MKLHPSGHSDECNVWTDVQQCEGPDLTRVCNCKQGKK